MYIAIHCAGMPFNGDTIPSGKSLGGSESAAYYMAKELVKLGHHVTCFTNYQHRNADGMVVGQWWDGVLYEWLGNPSQEYPLGDRFHMVMAAPFDVVIVQRHPQAFSRPINSKLNIWWLHDLALYRMGGVVQNHLCNIDKIFTVSKFHKDQVSKVYDIPEDTIINTINGVDYSMFEGLDQNMREPRSLFYMARPERGLENLVGYNDPIMGMLPDCHLYVCGYDNTTAEMAAYYQMLWKRCEELPNVTNLGHLGKRELYEAMSKCQLYVYPTVFEDTSCIAALEANAAGLPLIGSDWSAVPETMTGAGAILLPLVNGQVDKQAFAKTVRRVLSQPTLYDSLQKKALAKRQTWEDAARQWDQVFRDELAKKSSDPVRLAIHLEQMSDIVAADKAGVTKHIKGFETNYDFYLTGDYEGYYQRYYQYETDRGVNYGPESMQNNPRFETMLQLIMEHQPSTILDFGCAHGPVTMNLLARIPKGSVHVTGIDIGKTNIESAKAWAQKDGFENQTTWINGSIDYLKEHPEMMFDCIIASEVLEHLSDPQAYCNELIKHLNPGGLFVASTPFGPWEAIGYKDHPGIRNHLHHFERQDIIEMFGHMDGFKLVAVPHRDIFGHFVFAFRQTDGAEIRTIDYDRKLKQQAPYETLSVCMIAYNEEYSIGKALNSIKDIADEIIVGIDEKTTDRTREICESFGAKTFIIRSPLDQGFDEARNRTIEKATMDWILWFDADETLENAPNLGRYMRNNCYTGFAIKQHHYAIEPAALFQTDLPVRLFRNRKGVRFYGFVHEHPELEMNKGIGKVTVIEDVALMHTGYSTEQIRRGRFARNWPLMVKDRQKYPDRLLGKFLWMRDLTHYNRYLYERSGQISQDMIDNALVAVDMWRELVKAGNLRMAIDGLPYYSQASDLITRGAGIKFCLDAAVSKFNGGATLPRHPVEGIFTGKADIESLVGLYINSQTATLEDRYF